MGSSSKKKSGNWQIKSHMPTINKINSLQIFQVMQFGTTVLIGILLVKAGMPTSMVSVYEALMFLASLSCFFWVAGGQNALLQIFHTLSEAAQKRALFNVFSVFTMAGLATAGILFSFQNELSRGLTNFAQLPLLNWLALFVALNAPSFMLPIFYSLTGKYRQLVVFGAISFGFQTLAVVLPICFHLSLRESMQGLVLASFVKFAWSLHFVLRQTELRFDLGFLRQYWVLAFPMVLLAAIGKGSEYVSGLVVGQLFADEKTFAVFRYGAREMPLAVLMVGALATALIPETVQDRAAGLASIKAQTRRISHWLYPVSMASMLASPFLFPFFFNQDFKSSAQLFNIFNLLLMSRILLPQVVTMAAGRNMVLVVTAFVELVVLTLLSLWWGRKYGLQGVAWASVVAFMVDRVVLLWYNWKVLKVPPHHYVDWKNWLGYNLLLVIAFFISLQL